MAAGWGCTCEEMSGLDARSLMLRAAAAFHCSACCACLLCAQVPSFFNSLGFVIPERKEVADFLQVRQHTGHARAEGHT